MFKAPATIYDTIRQERNDFLYNFVEIVDGYQFSQYNNIKKLHKYYNSHYVDGDYETINGITRKKVFWNIGKRRATIATKQIDIDTKDFLLISQNQATEWNVFLLEKELKAWMRKEKYAKVLNQIADELPVYGSVVLRKTKDGAEVIDLRYFFCEQSAENLSKSRYKIIKHLMTPEAMREMDGTWDNVAEAIEKFAVTNTKSYEDGGQINIQNTTPQIEVYERFGEVPASYFDNEGAIYGDGDKRDDEWVYGRFICAGVDNSMTGQVTEQNPTGIYHAPGLILFSEQLKKKDDPFKEVHFRKTKGRWQGIGIIEDTYEDQRMLNKTKDQEDKAAELAALILFQTAEDMIARNVLTDVDNGEILKAKSGINRLDNQNRSLPEMQKMAEAYETHADRETFSADLLGGEAPPANATLGAVNQQVANSAGVYDYKKENFGLFLEEFISDLVFPDLQKKIMMPHTLRFQGDLNEMAKLRERAVDGYLRTKILESGDIPTQAEYDALKQKFIQGYQKEGSKMWIDIEKDFFRNLDYELSLEVTGESKNVQSWLNNLQAIFKMVGSNPQAVLANPILKKLLYKMLSAMGMSISELENADTEMAQQSQEQQNQARITEVMNLKDMPQDSQQQFLQKAGYPTKQGQPEQQTQPQR